MLIEYLPLKTILISKNNTGRCAAINFKFKKPESGIIAQ